MTRLATLLSLLAAACGGSPSGPPPDAGPAPAAEPASDAPEAVPPGMVWVPPGTFTRGTDDPAAPPDERPAHRVSVSGFFMDATEVTNDAFARFVEETGYVTTAERPVDWEELAAQLPPGTPRPPDERLAPGSLVFVPPADRVPLDVPVWWSWVPGADWRHPGGPPTSIEGKGDHPVVQVSWEDAAAYAAWAGKRLPTEAEWEWAARGATDGGRYAWGDEPLEEGRPKANTWQGTFPVENTTWDGWFATAPVRSFPPNALGLYEMSGNVWEWCADWYHAATYAACARTGPVEDPAGPDTPFDPREPTVPKRVQRGGSYLCNDAYCAGYRVSARMKSSPDTGLVHTGFRCVRTP